MTQNFQRRRRQVMTEQVIHGQGGGGVDPRIAGLTLEMHRI